MEEKNRYYVVTKKAVPEVLLKVVEAKRLLESAKASTVQEAADMVGISRSKATYYKLGASASIWQTTSGTSTTGKT